MRLHTFQELVSSIIHLSTRDGKSIPITFSGTDAYTNANTVNIPTLPAGTILTPHQFSIWMGYVIHEGPGHQTHTDLKLYTHTCQQRNSPQFSYILNLLEDIRIENADINLYPGDRKYLDSVHQFVDNKIPTHMAQNPDTMGLIYRHLFVHHRQLDTNIIRGKELDSILIKLLSQIDQCHSTQDCINLADKITQYLNNKKEEQKEQNLEHDQDKKPTIPSAARDVATDGEKNQENKNGNENDEENKVENGDKNDEKSESSNSDLINNDPSRNNNSSRNNNKQSIESDHRDQENNQSFIFSNQSTSTWQELTEIKNIINELKNQIDKNPSTQDPPDLNLSGKSIFPPENILNDRIYIPSTEDLYTFNQTRTECSSQILALKKMFRIYLQAKTTKSQIRGLEEGKLDTQRLYITATGQTTIFKDQHLKLLPLTAIELMIDLSGSMKANISRTTAIILTEALNSIPQIKLSISGFTTNNRNNVRGYEITNKNSGRYTGMDILNFKDFTTPYAKCKGKLGAITSKGFTPLGDAYGHALEHILTRSEPRRIIFLITDGSPEFCHGENHSDYLLMKKIYLTAKRFQIQTLSLGIGKNLKFLDNYFDHVVNISEISTLPKNLLEALKHFI